MVGCAPEASLVKVVILVLTYNSGMMSRTRRLKKAAVPAAELYTDLGQSLKLVTIACRAHSYALPYIVPFFGSTHLVTHEAYHVLPSR